MDDVLRLLDGLFAPEADRWTDGAASWWDGFYADRSKAVPFFVDKPDENLVAYLDRGLITPGRALDLGCGPGRNALHLAARGFEVDAVDLSPAAIAWAEDRARAAGAEIRFHCGDAFALTGTAPTGVTEPTDKAGPAGTDATAGPTGSPGSSAEPARATRPGALAGPYDLVYDSGCFHHLPPHRRVSHLALLDRVLAPGGHLALTCFAAGAMGSEVPDDALYRGSGDRQPGLYGGLGYTAESLRWIFADLTEVELRRMHDEPPDSSRFGEPFLWTALFRR